MSLDRLVREIRSRADAEAAAIEAGAQAESGRIIAELDRRLREIREESERATTQEIARERAQRIAAAQLRARQHLYEAREARLKEALGGTRRLLADFASTPSYPGVLEKMFALAAFELGPGLRVRGRAEDAALLEKVAGGAFDPAPIPLSGGLVAETADRKRRLNLSFDELLRLREDRVRRLLA